MVKLSRFCGMFLPLLALAIVGIVPYGSAQDKQKPTSGEDATIDLSARLISLSVSVTDHQGRPVTGLHKEDFQVSEGRSPQKIEFFALEDTPLTIGLVIDRSFSMREGNKFERVLDAARTFVDLSNPDDEFSLTLFSDKMTLVQDITKGRDAIRKAIGECESPKGTTLLYDTVYEMAEKLNRYETSHHKALVLLTDGDDNNSTRLASQVIKSVGSSNVQVYAIGIFGADYVRTAERFLRDITETSGGRAFFPKDSKNLAQIWSEIADELRHQYGIAYAPSHNRWDGTWHPIDVNIKRPDGFPKLKIRTRKGYFAFQQSR